MMQPFEKQLEDALNEVTTADLARQARRRNLKKVSGKKQQPAQRQEEPQQPEREDPKLFNNLILPKEDRELIKTITIKLNEFLVKLIQIKPELREFARGINKALNSLYGKTKLPLSAQEFDKIIYGEDDVENMLKQIAKIFRAGIDRIIKVIQKSKYNSPTQVYDYVQAYEKIVKSIESVL